MARGDRAQHNEPPYVGRRFRGASWLCLRLVLRRRARDTPSISWRGENVSAVQSTTLVYFMSDYVDHLKHHLREALKQR